MKENSEGTEGCIFDLDYSNYLFSLNRDSINKIKNGEKKESTIYHNSYLFKSKEDLQERMKKELILGLLSDNNSEIIVEPYEKGSKQVIIRISKNLLENLINSEGDNYEICYNSRGNKMNFYINDSSEKKELNQKIDSLKEKYSKGIQL